MPSVTLDCSFRSDPAKAVLTRKRTKHNGDGLIFDLSRDEVLTGHAPKPTLGQLLTSKFQINSEYAVSPQLENWYN